MKSVVFLLASAASSAMASSVACADVLTVGGINPAFADIPAAAAAAVDGDVLLVRSGDYNGFTLDGKALSVVADAGAAVNVYTCVTVRNLPAGKTVLLAGLTIRDVQEDRALLLDGNAGHVRIQSLSANSVGNPFGSTYEAVFVRLCADVAFASSTLRGPHGLNAGLDYLSPAEEALIAWSCNVALIDCTVEGGNGVDGYNDAIGLPHDGRDGAMAIDGVECVLVARGSTIRGGKGGKGLNGTLPPPGCSSTFDHATAGGAGGAGLRVQGTSPLANGYATLLAGGTGGAGGTSACGALPPGPDGPATIAPAGVVTSLPGPSLRFAVPQPAREGGNLALHFEGTPGMRVIVLQGNGGAGWLPQPSLRGVLLVAPTLRRLDFGVIPPSGVLDVAPPVPLDLGAGIQSRTVQVQAVFIDAQGRSHLAAPGTIVMLDAAF